MNYQSSNFGSEGIWNVKNDLKVQISFKIWIIFLSFVNLYVV